MIDILYDLIYQSSRNYGCMVDMESCRIFAVNSRYGLSWILMSGVVLQLSSTLYATRQKEPQQERPQVQPAAPVWLQVKNTLKLKTRQKYIGNCRDALNLRPKRCLHTRP